MGVFPVHRRGAASVPFGHLCAVLWPAGVNKFHRFLVQLYWEAALMLVHLNHVRFKISGDKLAALSAVIMLNHQLLADHLVVQYLARMASISPKPAVNFFSWYSLWSVPSLRLALNIAACDENWELSKAMSTALFGLVMTSESPEWIVVFPEVNIWTPTLAYLQRLQSLHFFLPQFDNLLYPRFSALYNALTLAKTMGGGKFATLYDVTVLYDGPNAPTLTRFFSSLEPILVNVHVKAHALTDVPVRRKRLEGWVEKQWLEKDRRLGRTKAVELEAAVLEMATEAHEGRAA